MRIGICLVLAAAYLLCAVLSWRPFALWEIEASQERDRQKWKRAPDEARLSAIGLGLGLAFFWPGVWPAILLFKAVHKLAAGNAFKTKQELAREARAREITELHNLRQLAREHGLEWPEVKRS